MIEADMALRGAIAAALRDDSELAAALNGVFEGVPVRASPPHAEIGEALASDWSTKDRRGREVRVAVLLRDATETPLRIAGLAGRAARAIEGMARDLDGWRLASLVPLRIRTASDGPGKWITALDYRARLFEHEET